MSDRLSGRMLFLVGAPRSGTNWLQRMLAAHPSVVALPSETHLFSHGLRMLDVQVQHGLLTSPSTGTVYLPREEWVAAMRAFCVLVYGRVADSIDPDARVVVERSPHHVEHLPLIGEVFPDAAVVHLIRDGRDVTRSLARHEWGPGGVAAAAGQWRDSVVKARAAAPALDRYLEVRYEELMRDPRAGLAVLFDRLGLPAGEQTLDAVAAAAGVRFNVDAGSRAIGVGKWRREWRPRDLAAFDRVAGPVLRELGYPELPLERGAAVSASRALRRAVHLLRRRGTPAGAVAPAPEHDPVITSMEAVQILVDRCLADLSQAMLPGGLTESVSIRYAGPDGSWSGHGTHGTERLREVIERDGPWGCQLRGEEQIHGRTVVVTTTHERAGDGRTDRVLVLGLTADNRLAHLGYSRFPLAVAGEERQ